MRSTPLPPQEVLHEILDYDPASGVLTWRPRALRFCSSLRDCNSWNARYAGKPAMTKVNSKGYHAGTIFGVAYTAHRVIWKWMTGQEPDVIDHENGVRTDNRWKNLLNGDCLANAQNAKKRSDNTSGVTGVSWFAHRSKWGVQISMKGRNKFLGTFDKFEDAVAARKAAEVRYSYHANHGRH